MYTLRTFSSNFILTNSFVVLFFFCTEEAETEEGTRVDWREVETEEGTRVDQREAETEEGTRVDQREAEKQGTKIYTCILHGLQWDKCTCTCTLHVHIHVHVH